MQKSSESKPKIFVYRVEGDSLVSEPAGKLDDRPFKKHLAKVFVERAVDALQSDSMLDFARQRGESIGESMLDFARHQRESMMDFARRQSLPSSLLARQQSE